MNPLDELYNELEQVESMTEAQVIARYNADSKEEIIELIREDIENLERKAETYRTDREVEDERTRICLLQGLARYC